MKELIRDFNNISLRDAITSSNLTIFCSICLLFLMIGFFILIMLETKNSSILVRLLWSSISTIIATTICFWVLYIISSDFVRINRLYEIVEFQKEHNINGLDITDDHIIYEDVACRHNISDIDDLVIKNDDKWIIINK